MFSATSEINHYKIKSIMQKLILIALYLIVNLIDSFIESLIN